MPNFAIFETCAMSGTVHTFPSGAFQLAVDSDWSVSVTAFWLVCAKNGWKKNWLRSAACSSPVNDHSWFASTPYVYAPFCFSATAVGPIAHFGPVRGSNAAGPAPQIQPLDRAGEKNSENVMSPATVDCGVLIVGMM